MSVVLSTAVLLVGQEINGSKRWLSLGPLSFQPSEFAKVAVILFIAWQITYIIIRRISNKNSMKKHFLLLILSLLFLPIAQGKVNSLQ